MLLNLLASSNLISFNIFVAKFTNIETAVYLSELLNIQEKAFRKNKIKEGFFKADKKYIEERTTLDSCAQKNCCNTLKTLKILEINEEDAIKIDLNILCSLISNEMISDAKEIKLCLPKKKSTKSEIIKEELKSLIKTSNNELRDSYMDWIDSVYAKQGWMSRKSVTCGEILIDSYADHNLDLALNIINIAALNGYRDIQWAINKYEEESRKNNYTRTGILKLNPTSDEIILSDKEVY